MKKFPTKKVTEITGVSGNDYVKWNNGTINQLKELVKIGAADPKETQNYSPTIQEFIDDLEGWGDKVKLIGYVIFPPRDDARVSVEGFTITGITGEQLLDVLNKYRHADDYSKEKLPGGKYSARFWWD